MTDDQKFEAIVRELGESNLFRNLRRSTSRIASGVTLEGEVTIAGCEVTMQLALDPQFPLSLPRFYLQRWDALGAIPHVDYIGQVCYIDPEGLVLDAQRPLDIIIDAFARVINVLTAGVNGDNSKDFADEFETYWGRQADLKTGISLFTPFETVSEIVLATKPDQLFILAKSEQDISAYYNGENVGGLYTIQKAIYLPLLKGTSILPPIPYKPFWNAAEIRDVLLPGLSETNRARLRRLIKRRVKLHEYIFIRLPRPSGGETLFGIHYVDAGPCHPLVEGGVATKIQPIFVHRRDKGYLVRRGGANIGLDKKRILLVGGGAVGGYLAFTLIRAGILEMTLVDSDILTDENCFRHVLGRRYWGKAKVTALKEEIETELPYARVVAIRATIEAALAKGDVILSDFDLIIVALGNPTIELALNAQLFSLSRQPPAIFTWLEPLGIGGHALLVGNEEGGGCYRCLYTAVPTDKSVLVNRSAFAAPGQFFGRALTGCGSLFTPYSVVDVQRTVALAADLALNTLTGRESGNPLLSWKGSTITFEEQGFRLSPRYTMTEGQLQQSRFAYRQDSCEICGRNQVRGLMGSVA